MLKSNKKLKLEPSSSSSTSTSSSSSSNRNTRNADKIHSGHYMTSYLHDQCEDSVEMPIASPDATNNEVTVNTLNQDEINDEIKQDIYNTTTNVNANMIDPIRAAQAVIINKSQTSQSSNPKVITVYRNNKAHQFVTYNDSISGGLTLDKTNKSLKNLIFYIKVCYSNNLTSPKWKNFKGLKLQVMEKIRLNNIIWRSWFEQYGIRDVRKRRAPLICQFNNAIEDQNQRAKQAVIDGKYWKRKLDSITNEYKKWREISRKQIKQSSDGSQTLDLIESIQPTNYKSSNLNANSLNNQMSYNNLNNANNNQMSTYNNSMNIDTTNASILNQTNNMGAVIASNMDTSNAYSSNNSFLSNNAGSVMNNNYSNDQTFYSNNLTVQYNQSMHPQTQANSNMNEFEYLNNNYSNQQTSGYYNNNDGQMVNQQQQVGYTIITNSGSPNVNNGMHFQSNMPLTSGKQMTYNNRCRSPSPGLFHDFDFNTLSDTLFSTFYYEDPKDQVGGINPDLFQPDLMHLYPNFDFFELDYDSNNNNNNSNGDNMQINSNMNVKQPNNLNSNKFKASSGKNAATTLNVNTLSANETFNIDMANGDAVPISSRANQLPIATKSLPQTDVSCVREVNELSRQTQAQQSIVATVDYSDLSNFDTLASVAAAQSQSLSSERMTTSQNSNTKSCIGNTNSNSSQSPPASSINSSSSSNTIRNLLAQQSPVLSVLNNLNGTSMRLNTGISAASGNTIIASNPSNQPSIMNQHKHHQQQSHSSSSSTINDLLNEKQANMFNRKDNQQLNALLSVILAPQQAVNHGSQAMSQSESLNLKPFQQQQQQPQQLPARRGRKPTKQTNKMTSENKMVVKETLQLPQQQQQQQQQLVLANQKEKPNLMKSPHKKFNNPNHINAISSSFNVNKNDQFESPIKFPLFFQNNLMTNMEKVANHTTLNSNDNSPLIESPSISSSNTDNSNNNLFALSEQYNSSSSLSTRLNNNNNRNNSLDYSSRITSRSNSVNSNDQAISAEQKRRCNIQHGFDRLQTLVPALADGKSKASKAAMLQKTAEYIKELRVAREARMRDLSVYKREIEQLSEQISECQNQLPANGVSVIGNLNKMEKFEQKFNAYVKERTIDNWKFYLFSLILKPLFDNFINTINTSSKEDMDRTFYEWQHKYCNLPQLRPIASNALRQLSKNTSILFDSSKMPEECYAAVLTKI